MSKKKFSGEVSVERIFSQNHNKFISENSQNKNDINTRSIEKISHKHTEKLKKTMRIDAHLHKKLKIISSSLGEPLQKIIEDFLWDGVKKSSME